jgi:hypothetical protein
MQQAFQVAIISIAVGTICQRGSHNDHMSRNTTTLARVIPTSILETSSPSGRQHNTARWPTAVITNGSPRSQQQHLSSHNSVHIGKLHSQAQNMLIPTRMMDCRFISFRGGSMFVPRPYFVPIFV